jgi:hypothetical protein
MRLGTAALGLVAFAFIAGDSPAEPRMVLIEELTNTG